MYSRQHTQTGAASGQHNAMTFTNGGRSNDNFHPLSALDEGGFIEIDKRATVECLGCGCKLYGWLPGTDPWKEHARWYPDCTYIRKVKGDDFISQCQNQHEDYLRALPTEVCYEGLSGEARLMESKSYTHLPTHLRLSLEALMDCDSVKLYLSRGVPRNLLLETIKAFLLADQDRVIEGVRRALSMALKLNDDKVKMPKPAECPTADSESQPHYWYPLQTLSRHTDPRVQKLEGSPRNAVIHPSSIENLGKETEIHHGKETRGCGVDETRREVNGPPANESNTRSAVLSNNAPPWYNTKTSQQQQQTQVHGSTRVVDEPQGDNTYKSRPYQAPGAHNRANQKKSLAFDCRQKLYQQTAHTQPAGSVHGHRAAKAAGIFFGHNSRDQTRIAEPVSRLKKDDDPEIEDLCNSCTETEIQVAFLPCGHAVTCRRCAAQLSQCNVCWKAVTGIRRLVQQSPSAEEVSML